MPQPVAQPSVLPANGPSDAAMTFLRTGNAPDMGQFQPTSAPAPSALQMAQEQFQRAINPAPVPEKPNLGTDQEMGPDGRARPIPGSELDRKNKEQVEKAALRAKNAAYEARSTIGFIKEAMGKTNELTAGIGAAVFSKLPRTSARALAADIDTIKANTGFQRLEQMRAESPTGGALGQVAVKELEFLQAVRGNLDTWQSPADLKRNLELVQKHYERFLMANSGFDPDTEEGRKAFYEASGSGESAPASQSGQGAIKIKSIKRL
jgi:hypothetical protein